MTTLRDLRAKAEAAEDVRTITRGVALIPAEDRAKIRFTFKADGPDAEFMIAASPDVVLALVQSVEELKAALESARDLAMRVGDGKHELSAKASVVYSHTSAALAAVDARFPREP